jgi:hypothetical protein
MYAIMCPLSTSVPYADDGDAGPFGHFDNFGDLIGMHFPHRTTKNGEILAEAEHSSPIDAAMTCDDTVSKLGVHVHIAISIPMGNQCINLDE